MCHKRYMYLRIQDLSYNIMCIIYNYHNVIIYTCDTHVLSMIHVYYRVLCMIHVYYRVLCMIHVYYRVLRSILTGSAAHANGWLLAGLESLDSDIGLSQSGTHWSSSDVTATRRTHSHTASIPWPYWPPHFKFLIFYKEIIPEDDCPWLCETFFLILKIFLKQIFKFEVKKFKRC